MRPYKSSWSVVYILLIFSIIFFILRKKIIVTIRTSFDLDSKTGLDSGPTSPNNKFVERGRKN